MKSFPAILFTSNKEIHYSSKRYTYFSGHLLFVTYFEKGMATVIVEDCIFAGLVDRMEEERWREGGAGIRCEQRNRLVGCEEG